MYALLGFINIGLIVIVLSPYWLGLINQHFLSHKNAGFNHFIKGIRKVHKPLGVALLAFIPIHGYLALGSIRLHTGSIAWIAILITASFGLLFFLTKKRALFRLHKGMALVFVVLIIIHLFFPNLLNILF